MIWALERSQEARADLIDIWSYIAVDNPDAADRQIDKIEALFNRLREYPRFGPERDDIADGLRGFVRGRYLVLYQLDESRRSVQIIRVIHGMRDLLTLFGDASR
jgi:toxin ParE1/3/4